MSVQPENLDTHEPTEAEIAAAAEQERKDAEAATRALRDASKDQPAKRGPGRPRGSTNKSKASTTARDAGKSSSVTAKKPLTGAAASAVAKKTAEQRAAHKAQVQLLTEEAMTYRTHLVSGIGMLTGLPPDFLVGIAGNEQGEPLDVEGRPLRLDPATGAPLPGQEPAMMLTHYGEALAPKEWQVRIPIDAGLRLMDSEQGEKLIAMWEKYAPTLYGVAALACVGIYTVSTLQAVSAIKPMVEVELKARADAARAAQDSGGTTPGGSS